MKSKYPVVRFALRASMSSFLAFMLVFFPSGRNVFASCSPASTNGDDTITCTSASDTINAQDGNDQVNGGGGNDSITGGAGNDTLTGGTGNDTYVFDTDVSLGTDIITEAASGGTDALNFTGSDNNISINIGTTGSQNVNANLIVNLTAAQVENVTGGNGNDVIAGNALANALSGGAGDDTLTGVDGNDTLTGGEGIDSLVGGTGNDTYAFDTDTALGTDTITEAVSGGTDALNFTGSSNTITVDLNVIGNQSVNNNLILNLTAVQMENVTGGSNSDTITGNALANSLTGGAGNDTLNGMAGNDTYNFDTDTALGTDTITEAVGGGADTLNFSGSTNAITVDMGLIGNQTVNSNLTLNLTAAQVDYITGGSNNDNLTGNALNNIFTGGAGDDTLIGVAGNDSYNFDTDSALGTDTITEAAGGGTDTLNFTGSSNALNINLGTVGNQTVNSNLALNLTAVQVENVTGGSNSDTITGNTLANTLSGGSGNDFLNGMNGNDTLTGDAGNDSLFGGAGDDSYAFDTDSSLGTDIITENAGEGTDTLNFAGSSNVVTVDLGTIGNQTINSNLILNLTASQVENVTGGTASDNITGNAFNNNLSGGTGGNDILNGMDGNDTLTGGAGNDSLLGGAGNDVYAFDADAALGTDTIVEVSGGGIDTMNFTGTSSATTVNLGLANQTVNSNLTLNLIAAEMENVVGGSGNDNITGTAFNNNLSGGAGGNDILNGMDGNDILTGGAGNDSLLGGAGDDVYAFDTDSALGTDTITEAAGGGTDTLDFSGSSNVVAVNLGTTGNQTVNSNLTLNLTDTQMENVTGGSNNDNITGNALNNILSGGTAGNDTLNGMDGNDTLIGGAGNDSLLGGAGDDNYVFYTDTALGTDVITENAGNGTDTLDFTGSSNAVAINLGTTGNQTINSNLVLNLTATQLENVHGGNGNDAIFGNSLNNVFVGGSGNDLLSGDDGDDKLDGDAGMDILNGGNGSDTLNGGADNDQLNGDAGADILNGGDGIDTLNGGADDDQLNGDAGADMLNGNDGADALNGGADDDQLNGDAGADVLNGGDGADVFNGGADNDQLNGDAGTDILNGGDGADVLNGGADDDQLNGDTGTDVLDGGDGDDTVNGGDGNDTLISSLGIDSLDGGADDDQLIITGEQTAGDVAAGGTGQNVFIFQPGTYGSLQLVSSGEDTLDFSLFDSPIAIDLNNFSLQNVSSNLSLTLTGLFKSVIGTVFDDTITGNGLDNSIEGLDGNDSLNGGAGNDTIQAGDGNDIVNGGSGMDTLDGEANVDTVVNYGAGDTHIDIESGFPAPSTNNPVTPIFHPAEASTSSIPVTSKKLLPIECDKNPFSLSFYQGSRLTFHNLCNYTVELDVFNGADMGGVRLPENIVPPYALSINLLKDNTRQDQIPEGAEIIWKIPAAQIKNLYFCGNSNNTEWTQLELKQVNGFYEVTIASPGTYLLAGK